MAAVIFESRALFRRREGGWLALAVTLGVVGGACMAFGQGARRSEIVPALLAASGHDIGARLRTPE